MTTFLICTYNEPTLLARIIARLRPYQVIVHVDAKVSIAPFRDGILDDDLSRVEFITDRNRVNWAGYSQVAAYRKLVRRGIEVSSPNEHLVLLSGQDYPLRSAREISRHLENSPKRQFMRYFEIACSSDDYRRQINRRHHRDLPFLTGRVLSSRWRKVRTAAIRGIDALTSHRPAPEVPPGLRPAFGPTHFALTAEFAAYLEGLVTPEVESFFRSTFGPDEKFYHTLAASGPRTVLNQTGNARGFEEFKGRGNWRYVNFHHIHPSLAKVYTSADWEEVETSRSLFLRKVDIASSSTLLDMIDARIDNRLESS